MKINRFIGAFDLECSTLVVDESEFYNQLKNVLCLRPGEEVILCDGMGREVRARILSYGNRTVHFELTSATDVAREVPVFVTLYAAMLKHEHFEFVVQKATEVGVGAIVPIVSARTVKKGFRPERLSVIMREASEQSGRALVPSLKPMMSFDDALRDARGAGSAILCDSSGVPLEGLSRNTSESLALFVGPEGGWDPDEVHAAERMGCRVVSLGRLVLRAETASAIAVYLASHRLL